MVILRWRGACISTQVPRFNPHDAVSAVGPSVMFPEVLRPAPGEGISARLIVPPVGKVPHECFSGQGGRGGAGTPRESDPSVHIQFQFEYTHL